ncbi:unnamed protein product [Aphanomyces euteiches]
MSRMINSLSDLMAGPNVPVAIAVPLESPSNEYNSLPQAELRTSSVAMAIPVADVRRVRTTLIAGHLHRLPFRRAISLQIVYFVAAYFIFLPPLWSSLFAWLVCFVGLYSTGPDVDVSHIRAAAAFAVVNICLGIYFMSYLAILSIAALTIQEELNYTQFLLSFMNMPVLGYAASKAYVYYHELMNQLQGGVTVVPPVEPVVRVVRHDLQD